MAKIEVTDNFPELIKRVHDAKPEDLLETLCNYADALYVRRGTLEDWLKPHSYEHIYLVRQAQEELGLLRKVLFNGPAFEEIMRSMFNKICTSTQNGAQTGNAAAFSTFYTELYSATYAISHNPYGKRNLDCERGPVFDFCDYVEAATSLKYYLTVGAPDISALEKHRASLGREHVRMAMPPEEKQ